MKSSNFKVVVSNTLSKGSEKRYVVIDVDTGEIVDYAQGYGYKSQQNAYSAYAYKTRDRSRDKEIRKWMKKHETFVELMDEIAFDILKESNGTVTLNAKIVKQMLKENHLEPSFTAGELLKEYRKRK